MSSLEVCDHSSTPMPDPDHSRLHIFNLPQEIQDIIFEYAYQTPTTSQIFNKCCLREYAECELDHAGRVVKYKVSDWLICKRWFVQAARARVEGRIVAVGVDTNQCHSADVSGVLAVLARSVRTRPLNLVHERPGTAFHERFPRLRHLKLAIHEHYFYGGSYSEIEEETWDDETVRQYWGTKIMLEQKAKTDELTDKELMESGPFVVLQRYAGLAQLKSVALEASNCSGSRSSNKVAFVRNVDRLEELIKEKLVWKRRVANHSTEEDPDRAHHVAQLYPGSLVDIESRIVKAPSWQGNVSSNSNSHRFRVMGSRFIKPRTSVKVIMLDMTEWMRDLLRDLLKLFRDELEIWSIRLDIRPYRQVALVFLAGLMLGAFVGLGVAKEELCG